MKPRLQPGWRLSDGERVTLAEIGTRTVKKLKRMEPDIFQPVTSDQIGLLKRKTRLAVICNAS